MTRKKLPIGRQTFREIREDDCYYVDNPPFALRMIDEGTPARCVTARAISIPSSRSRTRISSSPS
ncbi:MAG: hypothetical protein LBP86_09485 [Azoarcus sp.]|jgi:hypothetical protein|nr:hypothetical protein [Azoarcus sp.]